MEVLARQRVASHAEMVQRTMDAAEAAETAGGGEKAVEAARAAAKASTEAAEKLFENQMKMTVLEEVSFGNAMELAENSNICTVWTKAGAVGEAARTAEINGLPLDRLLNLSDEQWNKLFPALQKAVNPAGRSVFIFSLLSSASRSGGLGILHQYNPPGYLNPPANLCGLAIFARRRRCVSYPYGWETGFS